MRAASDALWRAPVTLGEVTGGGRGIAARHTFEWQAAGNRLTVVANNVSRVHVTTGGSRNANNNGLRQRKATMSNPAALYCPPAVVATVCEHTSQRCRTALLSRGQELFCSTTVAHVCCNIAAVRRRIARLSVRHIIQAVYQWWRPQVARRAVVVIGSGRCLWQAREEVEA